MNRWLMYKQVSIMLLVVLLPHLSLAVELEEIVVTAQKRSENLQDVPISINVISGDKLESGDITRLNDLSDYVPNLSFNQTGIGTNIGIRGISSGINPGFEQSVVVYVEEVSHGRAQLTRAPYLDLQRVEVLRGPQPTLFGKNAIAGAISIISKEPTDEFEGYLQGLYNPNENTNEVQLGVSVPLSDTLSSRFSILARETDGYYTNTTLDRDESFKEEGVYRATFLFKPNEKLSMKLKIENASFDTLGRFLEIVNPVTAPGANSYQTVLGVLTGGAYVLDTEQDFNRQANGDVDRNDSHEVIFTANYDTGSNLFTSITAFGEYDYFQICDCDFTGAPIFDTEAFESYEQFTQEFRMTSPEGEFVEYVAGILFQNYELTSDDALNVPTNSLLGIANPGFVPALGTATTRAYAQDSDLISAFAQVKRYFDNGVAVTLGGRYSSEEKFGSRTQIHVGQDGVPLDPNLPSVLNAVYSSVGFEVYDPIEGTRSENSFNISANLFWDFDDYSSYFVSVNTGSKAGGFDTRSNAHPDPNYNVLGVVGLSPEGAPIIVPIPIAPGSFEFEDESAINYEIGGKFVLGDGAATLNATLFRTSYKDLQISQFDGLLGFNVTNAGEATSQGIEIDWRWQVSNNWRVSGSLAFLDFIFDSFPNSQCYFQETTDYPDSSHIYNGLCNRSGDTREFTPELTYHIATEYSIPMGETMQLNLGLDLFHSDEYFISPTLDPNLVQGSYNTVDVRVALTNYNNDWELAVLAQNITDESIITFGNQSPLSTTLTQGGGTVYYAFFKAPTSLAMQLRYNF